MAQISYKNPTAPPPSKESVEHEFKKISRYFNKYKKIENLKENPLNGNFRDEFIDYLKNLIQTEEIMQETGEETTREKLNLLDLIEKKNVHEQILKNAEGSSSNNAEGSSSNNVGGFYKKSKKSRKQRKSKKSRKQRKTKGKR
jgi:hypothetical protein